MSLFRRIARDMNETAKGKIQWWGMGYVFSDKGYTNPQGVFLKSFPDDNGVPTSLKSKSHVLCLSADKGSEYPLVRGSYRVPKSICNKCEHRIKGGYCQVLRDLRKGGTAFGQLLTQATNDAQELLR